MRDSLKTVKDLEDQMKVVETESASEEAPGQHRLTRINLLLIRALQYHLGVQIRQTAELIDISESLDGIKEYLEDFAEAAEEGE